MLRNDLCPDCDKADCPFITIVTRCCKRPQALLNNIRSLKAQTDPDYEQVFIFDKVGHGLAAADRSLNMYKNINCGDYIMVLDDDDIITDNKFIEKLKIIKKESSPNVIIWQGKFFSETKILPLQDKFWGARPIKCQIGSFNYCMTHELYTKYVNVCRTGFTGDFDFINRVYFSDEKPKIEWIPEVFVSCQGSAGQGKIDGEVRTTSTGSTRRVIKRGKT